MAETNRPAHPTDATQLNAPGFISGGMAEPEISVTLPDVHETKPGSIYRDELGRCWRLTRTRDGWRWRRVRIITRRQFRLAMLGAIAFALLGGVGAWLVAGFEPVTALILAVLVTLALRVVILGECSVQDVPERDAAEAIDAAGQEAR